MKKILLSLVIASSLIGYVAANEQVASDTTIVEEETKVVVEGADVEQAEGDVAAEKAE